MKDLTYEKAVARIEEIAGTLEAGTVSLDDSMKLFEEASGLAKYCETCLKNAEQKITRLTERTEQEEE